MAVRYTWPRVGSCRKGGWGKALTSAIGWGDRQEVLEVRRTQTLKLGAENLPGGIGRAPASSGPAPFGKESLLPAFGSGSPSTAPVGVPTGSPHDFSVVKLELRPSGTAGRWLLAEDGAPAAVPDGAPLDFRIVEGVVRPSGTAGRWLFCEDAAPDADLALSPKQASTKAEGQCPQDFSVVKLELRPSGTAGRWLDAEDGARAEGQAPHDFSVVEAVVRPSGTAGRWLDSVSSVPVTPPSTRTTSFSSGDVGTTTGTAAGLSGASLGAAVLGKLQGEELKARYRLEPITVSHAGSFAGGLKAKVEGLEHKAANALQHAQAKIEAAFKQQKSPRAAKEVDAKAAPEERLTMHSLRGAYGC